MPIVINISLQLRKGLVMKCFHAKEFMKRNSVLCSSLIVMPMLLVVLGLMACVEHPVGDPERSQTSPEFLGMWLVEDSEGTTTLLMLRPYDERTYLAGVFSHHVVSGSVRPIRQFDGKAWLTALGDATYITIEPLVWAHYAGLTDKPPYLVGQIERVEDVLKLRMVDGGRAPVKDAADRDQLEAVLREHGDSDAVFADELLEFRRVDGPEVEAVLRAFRPTDFPED